MRPIGLAFQQNDAVTVGVLQAVSLFLPRELNPHQHLELRRCQRCMGEIRRAHRLEQRE